MALGATRTASSALAARLSGPRSPSRAARSRLGSWRRIAALELLQLLARLQAKLLRELAPGHAVGLQGVGLTCRAVEGEHQLVSQALLQRVPCDQRLELADELRVVPERQVRIDSLHKHREAHLLQPRDLGLGNPSYARSASAGPRHSPSASLSLSAARCGGAPAASAASRSKRATSNSCGSRWST